MGVNYKAKIWFSEIIVIYHGLYLQIIPSWRLLISNYVLLTLKDQN